MSEGPLDDRADFRVPQHVAYQPIDGTMVLVNFETDRVYELNATGSEVWKRVVAGDTVADMRVHLERRYDGDADQLATDLQRCLKQFLERGLATRNVEP